MSSIQQNGSTTTSLSTKNVGGAAINVGSSTSLLDNLSLGGSQTDVFGSAVVPDTVASGAYATTSLDNSDQNFAYNNQKPIAKRYTTTIAGSANSVLQSGADTPGIIRSIHKLEKVRTRRLTTAIRAGEWNVYTGQFVNAPTVAVDDWWSNSANDVSASSTDEAATPSRETPGELTYKLGQQLPVDVDYPSKTV